MHNQYLPTMYLDYLVSACRVTCGMYASVPSAEHATLTKHRPVNLPKGLTLRSVSIRGGARARVSGSGPGGWRITNSLTNPPANVGWHRGRSVRQQFTVHTDLLLSQVQVAVILIGRALSPPVRPSVRSLPSPAAEWAGCGRAVGARTALVPRSRAQLFSIVLPPLFFPFFFFCFFFSLAPFPSFVSAAVSRLVLVDESTPRRFPSIRSGGYGWPLEDCRPWTHGPTRRDWSVLGWCMGGGGVSCSALVYTVAPGASGSDI